MPALYSFSTAAYMPRLYCMNVQCFCSTRIFPSHKENKMNKYLLIAALVCLPSAYAATAQQSLMTTCNKDASGKKGDERKAFMKDCLSAKKEEKKLTPQQEKMAACATANKGKKGAEYKKAQSECLKK